MKRYSSGLLLAFATILINMDAYRTSKALASLFSARLGADSLDIGVIAICAGGSIDRLGMVWPKIFGSALGRAPVFWTDAGFLAGSGFLRRRKG